jgi:hypothetical protein
VKGAGLSVPGALAARNYAAYLKEVVSIGSVEFTAQHAAALKICGRIRTDTDHFDRVFL